MEAFSPVSPAWTEKAIHALQFCCPRCKQAASKSKQVWLNRRSPVITEDYSRKWQEFYLCECEQAWWAWSSDRPPSDLSKREDDAQPRL